MERVTTFMGLYAENELQKKLIFLIIVHTSHLISQKNSKLAQ